MLLFQCYREFAFLCCSGSIHPSIVFSALLSLSFWIFKLRNGGKKKGGEMAGRGNSTTLFFILLPASRPLSTLLLYFESTISRIFLYSKCYNTYIFISDIQSEETHDYLPTILICRQCTNVTNPVLDIVRLR